MQYSFESRWESAAETLSVYSGTLRLILEICQKWRFQSKMDGDNRQ